MAFHTANVSHPTVAREHSGTATAGSTKAQLTSSDQYCANGVWVKNEDADEDVRVFAPDYPEGFLLTSNASRFFPTDNVNRIYIQRAGSADVAVSYWGG